MAYDEHLAQRVRDLVAHRANITEKKMFGGLCFFLDGNMLCGIEIGRYMFRVGPEQYDTALAKPGASPLTKPMRGLVHVNAKACEGNKLDHWLELVEKFVNTLPSR